jgi:hypothetical protein
VPDDFWHMFLTLLMFNLVSCLFHFYLKQKRSRNTGDIHGDQHRKGDNVEGQHRLKKKRKKKASVEKELEEKDISLSAVSPENSLKCFVILAEINRKIGSTSWRE